MGLSWLLIVLSFFLFVLGLFGLIVGYRIFIARAFIQNIISDELYNEFIAVSILVLICFFMTGFYHEPGHILACNYFDVEVYNFSVGIVSYVNRGPAPSLHIHQVIGFMGGFIGFLWYSLFYLIFRNADRPLRITFLGYTFQQFLNSIVEGYVFWWYRRYVSIFMVVSMIVALSVAWIIEHRRNVHNEINEDYSARAQGI